MKEESVKELYLYIKDRLAGAGIQEAAGEAWIFLDWLCGISRADYYMDPGAPVPARMLEAVEKELRLRTKRIPLQYLMGTCEFMGYSFHVDGRVLIPRQDTERLVEWALDRISGEIEMRKRDPDKKGGNSKLPIASKTVQESDNHLSPVKVLDLCTGSGCIGISIKLMRPQAQVTLSDISEEALAVAAGNASDLEADVRLVRSDLFENLTGAYDYILSNPPYIPTEEIDALMPEVRDHEPLLALDGRGDGLAFYRKIIREAPDYLRPGGWLVFEIGMDQGDDVRKLFDKEGFRDIQIIKDYAGLDRVAAARFVNA